VKNDKWIKEMCEKNKMIAPFVDHQERKGVVSYGLSSYGYDIRISDEFRVPKGAYIDDDLLDPKHPEDIVYTGVKGDIVIPPSSYVLGRSLEYFRIPRGVITICQGKSTYARVGLVINVTPFEPEWEGHATMCLVNTSPLPLLVYAKEGIAQLIFLEGSGEPDVSYQDKGGKYQRSRGIVTSKVDDSDKDEKNDRLIYQSYRKRGQNKDKH
jgi:dCTP deaminase